jgi:putative YpdA family bacillithiol system oxidoreductase
MSRQAHDGRAAGEPVSLHPSLDPNRCVSIGACASACPEGDILGLVNGRAVLIEPQRCIGHGACAAACPVDAITLVFGTETRGVDIPHVRETFETNIEGIYIAGELGGMGLIRNAVTQGRQAAQSVARNRSRDPASLDVLIVGAGPAGLAAALQAHKDGLRYAIIDQDDMGGTILSYPRQKLVMTQPVEIPLYGRFTRREVLKEELLELWRDIVARTGVEVRTYERLETVTRPNGYFDITTTKGTYTARNVLLAIGRRGTPRKLGVPGEGTSKVTYRLIEPEQYRNGRVLVVGGGDSAVEAALALSREDGTHVTLSYRGEAFGRVKPANAEKIAAANRSGNVDLRLESEVVEIAPDRVALKENGDRRELANDYVIVCAGGEVPTALLRRLGVEIETKFGSR